MINSVRNVLLRWARKFSTSTHRILNLGLSAAMVASGVSLTAFAEDSELTSQVSEEAEDSAMEYDGQEIQKYSADCEEVQDVQEESENDSGCLEDSLKKTSEELLDESESYDASLPDEAESDDESRQGGEIQLLADEGPSSEGGGSELGANYYHSDSYIYWDVDNREFVRSATDGDESLSHLKSVKLNGIDVRYYNSNTTTAPEDSHQLIEYYPNATAGSSSTDYSTMETAYMDIVPEKGWYVTEVLVACTGNLARQGFTTPYSCGTWSSGGEYDEEFAVTRTGELEFELSSLAFAHMSESTYYFILISIEQISNEIYVEYDYGDILDLVSSDDLSSVEPYFTERDSNGNSQWTVTSSRNEYGNAESFDTGEMSNGTQYIYGYEYDPSETESWVHYANGISEAALKAAEAAGYTFAGWKAVYYIDCASTETPGGYNNYSYDFDNYIYGNEDDSTIYYNPGEDVLLETNVRLIAMWEPVPVSETPVLDIVKSADGREYHLGDTVIYTITVSRKNSSVDSCSNVTVRDELPESLLLSGIPAVSGVEDAQVSTDGNSFTVIIPELLTAQDVTITVAAEIVDASVDGLSIVNTAVADGDDCEECEDDAEITAYEDPTPELEISKTPTGNSYNVRDTITYTIVLKQTVENATAYDVILTDPDIDSSLVYEEGSLKVSGKEESEYQIFRNGDGSFMILFDSLSYGEEVTVTFDAKVRDDALLNAADPDNVRIFNTVQATFNEDPGADNPVSSTTENRVLNPHFSISKSSDRSYYNVNDTIHYAVLLGQTEEGAIAYDVVLDDSFIASGVEIDMDTLSVSGIDGSRWSVSESGNGGFIISFDSISTEKITIEYDAVIKDNSLAGSDIINTVSVSSAINDEEISDSCVVSVLKPSLSIEKEADKGAYSVGDRISYTIRVSRIVEDAIAYDTVISDPGVTEGVDLDMSTISVSGIDEGRYEISASGDGTFEISVGYLEYGETLVISIEGIITDSRLEGQEIINSASVTCSNNPETVEDNAAAYVYDSSAVVSKSADKEAYNVDDYVTYTVSVRQTTEGAHISDAVITDAIDEGMKIDEESFRVVVDGKELSPDEYGLEMTDYGFNLYIDSIFEEAVITYRALVADASLAGSSVNNHVTAVSNTDDIEESDSVTVDILKPVFTIEKKADREGYSIGDNIEFTLNVSQTAEDARGLDVVIDDSDFTEGLIIDLNSISAVRSDGGMCEIHASDDIEGGFTITADSLEYGETITVTFTAEIADASLIGKTIENTATVTSRNNPDIVSDDATAYVYEPGLVLTKEADGTAYNVDDYVSYTISVRQTSDDTHADGIVIADVIDEGMEIDAESFTVVADGKELSLGEYGLEITDYGFNLYIDSIFEEAVITYRALVADASLAGSSVTNSVTGTSSDAENVVNPDPVTVDILKPVFTIEKTTAREAYNYGDNVEYTLVVSRTTEDARGLDVVIDDSDFTDGLIIDLNSISAVRSDGGMCEIHASDDIEGGFTITADSLEYGETITVTFIAEIADASLIGKTIENTATVTSRNNSETVMDKAENPVYEPDIEISKSVDRSAADIGDVLSYQVMIARTDENASATGLVLEDFGTEDISIDVESLVITCNGNIMDESLYEVVPGDNGFSVSFERLDGAFELALSYTAVVVSDTPSTAVNTAALGYSGLTGTMEAEVPTDINEPEMALVKDADKDAAAIGDEIIYTVGISRKEEDAYVSELVITDEATENVEIDAASVKITVNGEDMNEEMYNVIPADGGFTIEFETLKGAFDMVITYSGTVLSGSPDTIVNTAVLECRELAEKGEKLTDTAETLILASDNEPVISMSKTVDRNIAEIGEEVTYTLSISQKEESAYVSDLTVTDSSTANVEISSDSIEIAVNGEAMDDSLYAVEPLDDGFIIDFETIEGVFDMTITYSGTILSVDPDTAVNTAILECRELNEKGEKLTDTAETAVNSPIITLEKTADRSSAEIDDEIVYTINVKQTEENMHVSDMLIDDSVTSNVEIDVSSIAVSLDGRAMDKGLYSVASTDDGFAIQFERLEGAFNMAITYKGTAVSANPGDAVNTVVLKASELDDDLTSSAVTKISPFAFASDESGNNDSVPVEDEEDLEVSSVSTGDSGMLLTAGIAFMSCVAVAAVIVRRRKARP